MTARAWIDLETTGADETRGSILEIGVVIVDDNLDVLDQRHILVEPDSHHLAEMSSVVREMHRTNGLLAEIERGLEQKAADGSCELRTVQAADRHLHDVLTRHANKGQVILAGSGVGHFDARWIRAHLPLTHSVLTFWTHDVGVVRRFLGEIDKRLIRPIPGGIKSHRGLDDARDHLDEWRHYAGMIRDLMVDRGRVAELETTIDAAVGMLEAGGDPAEVAALLRGDNA